MSAAMKLRVVSRVYHCESAFCLGAMLVREAAEALLRVLA